MNKNFEKGSEGQKIPVYIQNLQWLLNWKKIVWTFFEEAHPKILEQGPTEIFIFQNMQWHLIMEKTIWNFSWQWSEMKFQTQKKINFIFRIYNRFLLFINF